jgi:flagellar basal body rod protein FlgG
VDEIQQTVAQIASAFNESNVDLLRKVVEVIGVARAQGFLQKTLATEAACS